MKKMKDMIAKIESLESRIRNFDEMLAVTNITSINVDIFNATTKKGFRFKGNFAEILEVVAKERCLLAAELEPLKRKFSLLEELIGE